MNFLLRFCIDLFRRERAHPHVATLAAVVTSMAISLIGTSAQASTLTVTSLADSGAGSLRQTVLTAGPGDTISLQTLSGTIALAAPIDLNKPLTLVANGATTLAIAGSGGARLFNTSSTITITDITLRNGADQQGGAIYNTGNLTLQRVALRANVAFDGGGAIFNLSNGPGSGVLTLNACELSGNNVTGTSAIGGGAIVSTSSTGSGATLTIINSTLTNNTTSVGGSTSVGGAIYASRGSVNVIASTIDGNHASATGANLHQGTVAGSSLTMRNSVVGDALLDIAAASSDQDIFLPTGAAVTSFGYNIVTHRPAAGFSSADAADGTAPNLAPLANNGGPTSTLKPAFTSAAVGFVPLASCVDENGAALQADQRGSARRAPGATTCDAGAFEYSYLSATAYSQKVHAGVQYRFPLNGLTPVGGAVPVEPRAIGPGHTIVFTFASPVSSVGGATAVNAAGVAIGTVAAPVISGNEVSVNLTGVADGQRVKVSLLGVNGSTNTSVALGFLVGDVIGSRTVGNPQVVVLRGSAGQPVTGSNFLLDLNLSGRIGAAEIAAVKARSGKTLP